VAAEWIEPAFWASLALLFYTFAGYPLALELLARVRPRPVRRSGFVVNPDVAVLLVARAGEPRILSRLANLASTSYPMDRFSVVLVRDGGTDPAPPALPPQPFPLRVIDLPPDSGKPAGINAGLAAIGGGIVVFADARQEFAPDAIPLLVRNFSDPEVGAVSGALEIRGAESAVGAGVDGYWKLEKRVRWLESRTGSCVGCTGAIYAARREALAPIPEDTWVDDVVIPMTIAQRGLRVLFEPEALAFDPQPLEPAQENARKPRTLGGNIQFAARNPGWMIPGIGRLWWRFLSHKILRLAGPLLLAAAVTSGALLAPRHPAYAALFLGQIGLYALGAIGLFTRSRAPILRFPAGFLFLNAMVVRGYVFWFRNRGRRAWAGPAR
jgi:hypothetical protein